MPLPDLGEERLLGARCITKVEGNQKLLVGIGWSLPLKGKGPGGP